MWAHCHRVNAGINTNMAIESLNNLLKTNQLGRKMNITIDKLLDEMENLVELKMWQRILNFERPHANNYHDKIIIKAHRAAEKMNVGDVKTVGFGEFLVKSSGDKFYKVMYDKFCETECKTLYCRVCKICIHRYKCECQQYCVKTTICKHIHLVNLCEQRKGSDFVLGNFVEMLTEESPSEIKKGHEQEVQKFLEEKENLYGVKVQSAEEKRRVLLKTFGQFLNNLDDEDLDSIGGKLGVIMEQHCRSKIRKRKMEKQEYYPSKKRS